LIARDFCLTATGVALQWAFFREVRRGVTGYEPVPSIPLTV
jgi:hypothetical protein